MSNQRKHYELQPTGPEWRQIVRLSKETSQTTLRRATTCFTNPNRSPGARFRAPSLKICPFVLNLRPERRSDEMDGATCWTYPRNLDRLCLMGNVFVNVFVVATVATSTFSFVSLEFCLELDLVKGYTTRLRTPRWRVREARAPASIATLFHAALQNIDFRIEAETQPKNIKKKLHAPGNYTMVL